MVQGANNALRSVVEKNRPGPNRNPRLDGKGAYTVWNPVHFPPEYGRLVARAAADRAHRVLLATVPHVTVAPIANGVNPDGPGKWRNGSRYFPYYTDPWIAEADFRPDKHRHLTHQQARAIDSAIDQFNAPSTTLSAGPVRRAATVSARPLRDPRRPCVPPLPR